MSDSKKRRRSETLAVSTQRKAIRMDTEDKQSAELLKETFRVAVNVRSEPKLGASGPYAYNASTKDMDEASKQEMIKNKFMQLEQALLRDIRKYESDEDEEVDDDDESSESSSETDSEKGLWGYGLEDDFEDSDVLGWDWLEELECEVMMTSTETSKEVRVGRCNAKLIRRARIRNVFHDEMNSQSLGTSDLASTLFDEYGRLRSMFKTHPVKRGSGIWQDELDSGDLLLFERIYVDPLYRRRSLGRQMFTQVCEKARKMTDQPLVTVIEPRCFLDELRRATRGVTTEVMDILCDEARDIAVRFWRELGFRRVGSSEWFGFASDPKHACHRLKATDDYDPPISESHESSPVLAAIFKTIATQSDDEALKYFKEKLLDLPDSEPFWRTTDILGNSILHVAGFCYKPKLVRWILQQSFGAELPTVRNNVGDNPLDAFLLQLESERTEEIYCPFSNPPPKTGLFEGFSAAAVECHILLKGIAQPSETDMLQLKYGCSCGECVGGFLSPRTLHALLCQAEINYDMHRDFCDDEPGQEFVDYHSDELESLCRDTQEDMATDRAMREGFVALFNYFAVCLDNKELPLEQAVMEVIENDDSIQSQAALYYLETGGTGFAVGSTLFHKAKEQDRWTGDGEHWETFKDEIEKLPTCRNDHEWHFVSNMCAYNRDRRKYFDEW